MLLFRRLCDQDTRAQYRGPLHCLYRIFTEESLRQFWTSTMPRLARLVVHFPSYSFLSPRPVVCVTK